MTQYFHDIVQGSDEWHELRLGMITASEMNKILTPTLKTANNKETRTHLYELAAQRITQHVDPHYVSYDMERGKLEETDARIEYEKHYDPVKLCGFVVNKTLGFPVGFSPDGLVGDDGFIEIKSRVAKYQVQTIVEYLANDTPDTPIPIEFMLQCQTGLFVTGRKWCDFVSFSNGFNMLKIRTFPDPTYQAAISLAAEYADNKIRGIVRQCKGVTSDIHPVARADYSEEISLT